MHDSEKVRGTGISSRHHLYASQVIREMGLTDVMKSGNPFIWSNHKKGESLIGVRLDRALANSLWLAHFSDALLTTLVPIGSDHAPVLLNTNPQSIKLVRPFRLFEYWLGHKDYKSVLESVWNHQVPSRDRDVIQQFY